jgi:plasmid stability protein
MSMKKFDIEKMIAKKVTGQMKAGGVPGRFGQGAGEVLDKRERRARDAAAGLVPFACKLPGELIKQLHERAAAHEGGINALTAELLKQALAQDVAPETPPKAAAKKKAPAVKKAAAE